MQRDKQTVRNRLRQKHRDRSNWKVGGRDKRGIKQSECVQSEMHGILI